MESVASRISANHVSHKNNANASLKVTNRGNSASMNLSKSTHNIPSSMSGVSSLFPSDSLLGFIEKTSENTLECRVNSARYTLKSVFFDLRIRFCKYRFESKQSRTRQDDQAPILVIKVWMSGVF